MQGLLKGALMSASVLILWGCSTAPSQPKTVVVRDVTAACPPPVVQIDRSFAAEPPACLAGLTPFLYSTESKWIEALADGTGEIAEQSACLKAVQDWLEAERTARKTEPSS